MSAITMARGDSYPIPVTVKSGGEVVDITGGTFFLTVVSKSAPIDDSTKVFSVQGTVVSGPEGVVTFLPTPAQTSTAGKFFYDIQFTDSNGYIRTILMGEFTILQDRTK